jgi:uncharacterized protein YbjT (DUF2867 family)
MKLVVFGAAGRVGGQVVRAALADGHEVTAAVRRPEALPLRHERLDVVHADVMSESGLDELVMAKEGVVFAVGSPDRKTTLVYSDGLHNVMEAMRATGVPRLVCLSSTIVEVPDSGLAYRLFTRFVVDKVLRNRLLDMARMEAEVRHSGLDWTVVRLPRLRDGAGTGNVRRAVDARLSRPGPLTRDAVARYVVRQLDDPTAYRTTVEIGS